MNTVTLKPGREKSLLRRHPWVFASAIARADQTAVPGETVEIRSSAGAFLAVAAYNPRSQIALRIWDWRERPIDAQFFGERLQHAIDLRRALFPAQMPGALRLVHAESDGLPGLIVDRYADTLVVQCSSAGAQLWRDTLADLLVDITNTSHVFERSDADVLALEGLQPNVGPLRGSPCSEQLCAVEHGLSFRIDVARGHKTGFYLDQRDSRGCVRELARGLDVLDCFCYTGGFTLNALAGGAKSVLAVDSSADALALARENVALNELPSTRVHFLHSDVFQVLRGLRDKAASFDLIVLDPPKFAPTVQFVEKAARAYKDINLLAFKLLRPGGTLATFSCSGGVSPELFQKIIAGAALDAKVDARIVECLHATPDHPVALNFPEGAYLKGLLCRIGI